MFYFSGSFCRVLRLLLDTQLTGQPTGYYTKTAGTVSHYVSMARKTSLRVSGIKVICTEKIKTDK